MRGKENTAYGCMNLSGITPACAGKSVCVECVAPERKDHPRVCGEKLLRFLDGKSQAKDHPRVCGEKLEIFDSADALMGSPPRVRGKVGAECPRIKVLGITPACAGKRMLFTLSDWYS